MLKIKVSAKSHDELDAYMKALGYVRASKKTFADLANLSEADLDKLASAKTGGLRVYKPDDYINPDGTITHRDEVETAAPAKEEPAEADKPKRTRRTKAEIEAAQQIQTQPENRVDPETAKQDAQDEAADTAANAKTEELTLDNVRHALGAYVKVYGVEAAQEDGSKLFKILFPDGSVKKVTDIPNDQASIARVRDGFVEMREKNPFKRDLAPAE